MQRAAAAVFTVLITASSPALAKEPTDAHLGQLGKNALAVKQQVVFGKLAPAQVAELKALIALAKKRDPKLAGRWSAFLLQAKKLKTSPEVVAASLALVVNRAMLFPELRTALGRCKPGTLRLMAKLGLRRMPACASGTGPSDSMKGQLLQKLQQDLKSMYELLSAMMKSMHDMQMKPLRSLR